MSMGNAVCQSWRRQGVSMLLPPLFVVPLLPMPAHTPLPPLLLRALPLACSLANLSATETEGQGWEGNWYPHSCLQNLLQLFNNSRESHWMAWVVWNKLLMTSRCSHSNSNRGMPPWTPWVWAPQKAQA
jgi:hypothetical protein